jgi:hypothetical protein
MATNIFPYVTVASDGTTVSSVTNGGVTFTTQVTSCSYDFHIPIWESMVLAGILAAGIYLMFIRRKSS